LLSNLGGVTRLFPCLVLLCPLLFSQSTVRPADARSQPVALRIIVVSTREKAADVLSRLRKGDDFATVARRESIDPSAAEGGLLGEVSPSALRPELRDALAGVARGQLSEIVKVPTGFAILKPEDPGATATVTPPTSSVPTALNSVGSVKLVFSLGGLEQTEYGFSSLEKPDGWDRNPRRICQVRQASLDHQRQTLDDLLAPGSNAQRDSLPALDLMDAYYASGETYSYEGNMDLAIPRYQQAYEVAASQAPQALQKNEEALGVAYLHKSEMENGLYRAPGDRCLNPMSRASAFTNQKDSKIAIQHFLKYLEKQPDEIEVRWLLNFAFMTVGGYPDQVPPEYLIPPSAFESPENLGRFHDVAEQAGLSSFSMAGGVIVDDFENNGRYDVVTSSMDSCGPLRYFHNNGDGTFVEQSSKAGFGDQVGGLNIMQADYNNDGCLDILVLRGGWEIPQRKSLLRNNCDGTFTDVTAAAGLDQPSSTQTAVWVDINNDGLLDLFVGNESQPAQLFLNKGDGTFEDIAAGAGVNRVMFTKGVTAGDYDNDGFMDLYVSNLNGANFLYHNNHDNTFTEVSQSAAVPGPGRGFATWFFDYDNDGFPDIFVTSYFLSLDETARTYLKLPHNAETLKLYHNQGDGTFRDVTQEVGLDRVYMPMGSNFGDIDNDGFLDIFLGTGNPSYASLKPSVLLHNQAGKRFVDATASTGTGEWHKGHGVAFADLENRGDEDLIFEVGGATRGDAHTLRVFENPGHGNDWISLKLVGKKSNRAAIGARIKVTVENNGQKRSIYRTVGSGGSFGASPLQQHIGLGKDARILDMEIWWPASNTRQHFAGVKKNQFLEIHEFAQEYAKLDRKPVRLGGARRDATEAAKQPPAIRAAQN